MAYGITSAGFIPKTRDTIYSELCANAIAASGNPDLDVSADSDTGLFLGVLADALGVQWATTEAAYTASYPDGATGVPLENICALTGVPRLGETFSEVEVTCTGTADTHVSAGTLFSQGPGTPNVAVMEEAIIPVGGTIVVQCKAVAAGPTYFLSGTVNTIVTPVAGLTSVVNTFDQYILGSNAETYEALRIRREASLRALGGSGVDAIRAAVLLVTGVNECYVLNNDTDAVVDTMPAHSFEVIVDGGSNQDIGQAILNTKPVGVYCFGTSAVDGSFIVGDTYTITFVGTTDFTALGAASNTVGVTFTATGNGGGGSGTAMSEPRITDSAGSTRVVRMTRPPPVNIGVYVEVETWGAVPVGLATSIKAAIIAQEVSYHAGNDVYASRFIRSIYDVSSCIQNVKFVTLTQAAPPATPAIPTSASPTTIAIPSRNKANFDSSWVTVVVTALGSI